MVSCGPPRTTKQEEELWKPLDPLEDPLSAPEISFQLVLEPLRGVLLMSESPRQPQASRSFPGTPWYVL